MHQPKESIKHFLPISFEGIIKLHQSAPFITLRVKNPVNYAINLLLLIQIVSETVVFLHHYLLL